MIEVLQIGRFVSYTFRAINGIVASQPDDIFLLLEEGKKWKLVYFWFQSCHQFSVIVTKTGNVLRYLKHRAFFLCTQFSRENYTLVEYPSNPL